MSGLRVLLGLVSGLAVLAAADVRSEERPPVLIEHGAVVKDTMLADGCVICEGARVERPQQCGPRIRTDTRLEALRTRVRTPRTFSDTISMGICRRRRPLWHLEGGELATPRRTR